jgi:hypothetical protein
MPLPSSPGFFLVDDSSELELMMGELGGMNWGMCGGLEMGISTLVQIWFMDVLLKNKCAPFSTPSVPLPSSMACSGSLIKCANNLQGVLLLSLDNQFLVYVPVPVSL